MSFLRQGTFTFREVLRGILVHDSGMCTVNSRRQGRETLGVKRAPQGIDHRSANDYMEKRRKAKFYTVVRRAQGSSTNVTNVTGDAQAFE